MPIYCYVCEKCGERDEAQRRVSSRNKKWLCAWCGFPMTRDRAAEQVGTDTQDYAREILSESMGVSAHQVQDHRRQHPNIPMTDTGEIVIRNGAEERRIKKELAAAFRLS